MLNRLNKLFLNNLPLKLLSLGLAILVWYMVVYNNDPIETKSYSIHVEVTNSAYIENGKEVYRVEDEYKTVTVYVKTNRSVLNSLSEKDISVTADLTQIVDLDRDPVVVPLQVSSSKVDATAMTISRSTIPITIENVASQVFQITVMTGDTTPSKDYEVGTLTASPNTVTIKGPESIVTQIDSVVAQIDVTNLSQDTERVADLVLIDKNQEEISSETISDDLTFDGESKAPAITVQVELWKKQSDVTMKVETSGTPASGYTVGEITTLPTDLTVVGDENALAELAANGNTITIPDISVEGRTEDFTTDVDITDLLPENMRVSSSNSTEVTVAVSILEEDSKEFTVDVEKIMTEGLDENLVVTYDQSDFKIRVKADSGDLNSLNASDITCSMNLSGKEAGDYEMPITVSLPEGYSLLETPELTIHVKEKVGS